LTCIVSGEQANRRLFYGRNKLFRVSLDCLKKTYSQSFIWRYGKRVNFR